MQLNGYDWIVGRERICPTSDLSSSRKGLSGRGERLAGNEAEDVHVSAAVSIAEMRLRKNFKLLLSLFVCLFVCLCFCLLGFCLPFYFCFCFLFFLFFFSSRVCRTCRNELDNLAERQSRSNLSKLPIVST